MFKRTIIVLAVAMLLAVCVQSLRAPVSEERTGKKTIVYVPGGKGERDLGFRPLSSRPPKTANAFVAPTLAPNTSGDNVAAQLQQNA